MKLSKVFVGTVKADDIQNMLEAAERAGADLATTKFGVETGTQDGVLRLEVTLVW